MIKRYGGDLLTYKQNFGSTKPFNYDVKQGYLYSTWKKFVVAKIDIEWIKYGPDLDIKKDWIYDFSPEGNRGFEELFINKNPKWICIKVVGLKELDRKNWVKCSFFKSYRTGKNLKRDYIRNWVIVQDEFL